MGGSGLPERPETSTRCLRSPRRKKAMEAELLRSKTELMMLNNQLLEAVQKRLELSLELEAWKVNWGRRGGCGCNVRELACGGLQSRMPLQVTAVAC